MNFGTAMELVKSGFRVRRKAWGTGERLEIANEISYKNVDDCVVYATNRSIVFIGCNHIFVGWYGSQRDVLAEDWEIVKL